VDIGSIFLSHTQGSSFAQIPMREPNFGNDSFRNLFAKFTSSNLVVNAGMDRNAIHAAVSNALAGEGTSQVTANPNSRFIQSALPQHLQQGNFERLNIRDYYPPFTSRELHEKLLDAQYTLLRQTNFNGMSDVEILDYIENFFIEKFGENFDKAFVLNIWSDEFYSEHASQAMPLPHGERDFFHIGCMFRRIQGSIFGPDPERRQAAHRERLFGDKSDDEIRETIMDRFSPPLTYRDLATMHREMREVGLFQRETERFFGNAVRHGITHLIISGIGHYDNNNWAAVLNRPVNWHNVMNSQNSCFQLGNRIPSKEFLRFFEDIIPRFTSGSEQSSLNSWLSSVRSLGAV